MNDVATQIETNTKTMMILFDERKEMILELMAMVKEMHAIVVKQQEVIKILTAEIMRLRADKANNPASYRSQKALRKPIHSKLRFSQHVSRRLNARTDRTTLEGRCRVVDWAVGSTRWKDFV